MNSSVASLGQPQEEGAFYVEQLFAFQPSPHFSFPSLLSHLN
jgi:hypothetical protein